VGAVEGHRRGVAGGGDGGTRGGGAGAGAAFGVDGAADCGDGFVGPVCAGVFVLSSCGVVGGGYGFDLHWGVAGAQGGRAAGPLNGARRVGRAAAAPGSDFDGHGCLRVGVLG